MIKPTNKTNISGKVKSTIKINKTTQIRLKKLSLRSETYDKFLNKLMDSYADVNKIERFISIDNILKMTYDISRASDILIRKHINSGIKTNIRRNPKLIENFKRSELIDKKSN